MSLSWTPWLIGLKPGSANDLIKAKDVAMGSGKLLGTGLVALVQLGGAQPPQPVMEGSGRSSYAILAMDTPILSFNQYGRFGTPADRHRRLALHGQPGADFAATPNPGNQWRQLCLGWRRQTAQRIHRARRCCPRCSWENSRFVSWRCW